MESLNLTEWKKTMYCGELHAGHIGKKVTLFGWVHRFRDMGSLIFIDLRDREGLIQIVVSGGDKELLAKARNTRMETVLGVRGVVEKRGEKDKNPRISTGEVEVRAKDMIILNTADVSPFVVSDPVQASEELRFKYRYLDLRRPSMQKNLKLRHQAAIKTRNYFNDNGFYEIETPFLTKSTPEGARDYLVPSRIYKGRFFALPQSPQLFKQLLMISGFDRYFQIVRCFRDEDLRADRQPEFTQVDVEMSFVEMADIFNLVENLMVEIFGLIDISVSSPFPRLTYEESMSRFGTDKPDLRFGMEISDLTEPGKQVGSRIIQDAIASGS
ncbi:MAG: aspartate--tRNA ligase, partial [Candidatus Aminicenantes bacterium]|nr:aspartate--tRNA ligase [Candidatus Aminicenantes bacterium]